MGSVNVSTIIGDIEKYRNNPALMQRASLETFRAIMDNSVDFVDATNPFIYCMENTAVNTAAFMQQSEAILRRQYASLAIEPEDLYYHMSDKDYIGRFALPSKASITILFEKDELYNALILDPATDISKVTIPRNTVFTVADTNFSLQYPIDIRRLSHGGLQIVYDVRKISPLQELQTNIVLSNEVTLGGKTFVEFTVETSQFDIITKYNAINAATGFKTSISIKDQFYYARVYMQLDNGSWSEIQTTHSLQIYDPKTPTAVIEVLPKTINVTIPVVYTSTNLIRNTLRIDIYQTKGDVNLSLNNYGFSDFSGVWKAIDKVEEDKYVSALSDIKTMGLFSRSVVSGGRGALTLSELRQRVIQNNVGPQLLPITNVQLQSTIEDKGYEVVKNIDTITNRILLATKPMPKPVDERLITAAASAVATVVLSFDEAALAFGTKIHDRAITITPDALYVNNNGVTKLVTTTAYNALQALPNSLKCTNVNSSNYLYSPFHYVLDARTTNFVIRPYYLDAPEIISKSFVQENAATGLQASVDTTYVIEKTSTGYRLSISTISNDAFKALPDNKVFCQMSFVTETQPLASFMLGVQLTRAADAERVFIFDMTSDFNLNSTHQLDQTAFSFGPAGLPTFSNLLQDMDIFFITTATLPVSLQFTNIDNRLGKFQLPSNAIGITHEKMKLNYGYSLDTLWARARSVLSSVPYKTYTTAQPKLYDADVFSVDPVTGAAFSINGSGNLVYNYLHRKNDPVLDGSSNPVYVHLAGEPQLDEFGSPLPADNYESKMIRHIDITVIEGAYRFATDSVARDYRKLIDTSLVSWITQDLVSLNKPLLDKTNIYFYPKVTQGDISIISKDGIESKIIAGQEFNLILHITEDTDNNPLLKESLIRTSIKTIDANIKGLTTAVSAIEYALRNQYGSDVIDVKLSGLGGANEFDTITVIDKANRLSIKKNLVAQPDNQLIVKEAVTVEFIKHAIVPK